MSILKDAVLDKYEELRSELPKWLSDKENEISDIIYEEAMKQLDKEFKELFGRGVSGSDDN
jgi:hypothetical protein